MGHTAVDQKVFSQFPGFRRGIVVAEGMDNGGTSDELESLLRDAIAKAAAAPFDLKTDPRTEVWNETYRALGCNPNKYPPAHLSLLKRVQKPGASIPFISKTVAIMNLNSIKGILPVGGDDIGVAGGRLLLRPAIGDERFVPLDAPDTVEAPTPGEIIYIAEEMGDVMCRRWNWRNGFKTRITEGTKSIVMNIDGMGDGAEGRCLAIRDSVAEMLARYCGARVRTALLSPSSPEFAF